MVNSMTPKLIIGIDATNIRGGGGVTHIVELLAATKPCALGITKIIIWGCSQVLAKLPDRTWLVKVSPPFLNRGLFARTLWQRFALSDAASAEQCDVLFVPGGSYAGSFRPIVTMSQNLLPFECSELNRYGITMMALKLRILRYTQSHSFKCADGVIFLTEYAKQAVLKVTGQLVGSTAIIPHGISPRFRMPLKKQLPIEDYTEANPYRILYVSIIDQYKHQWHVIDAVHSLRVQGLPVVLELIGPAYPPALTRLNSTIARFDPEKIWLHYYGAVSYESLHEAYAKADMGVFASSCENMPIILLETMASGLPVACSNRGPMPEVLGDAGVFFDPESPEDIACGLRELIDSPELRTKVSKASLERVQAFSWRRCASETFGFLFDIANTFRLKSQS